MLETILENLPKVSKPENKVLLILSGGLDSTILLYLLKRKYNENVIALTMDYNQRHSIEIEKAKISCSKTNTSHKIIDLKFFGDLIAPVSALSNKKEIDMPTIQQVLGNSQPVSYVPFRNLLFLSLALSVAEVNSCEYIFIGVQSNDLYGYWDTTPEFIQRINFTAQLNRLHSIQIKSPFVYLTKKDEILIGKELGVPFEDTNTCYDSVDGIGCANCPSCAERIKNFMESGIKDPVKYQKEIEWNV